MKIITDLNHLRKKCNPIPLHKSLQIGKRMLMWLAVKKQIAEMTLGLACNQLGLAGRVIVVRNQGKGKFIIFINPRITHFSDDKVMSMESCLSVPDREVEVERSSRIELRDDYQCCGTVTFTGQEAIIIQHEIDHLNGIVISDKLEVVK
tara:strand:- start:101 stop:547 length:447 start_codon:yes stop_codon:yes gene_type:complete